MNAFFAVFVIIWQTIRAFFLIFVPKVCRLKDVNNEVVLITGGGGGFGKALAIRFARKGAKIVLWDVSARGLSDACDAITSIGGNCTTYVCDITKREEVYATARLVREEVGAVTILVNNAGIASCKYFMNIPDENIIRTMEVNVMAHFWIVKAFLPDMMDENHGHIVTISSIAGLLGTDRLSDYCASKHAAVGFADSLRVELQNLKMTGINTTVVCPYYMNTAMFEGVKLPGLFPILKVEKVADYVFLAILSNTEFVMLPKLSFLLLFLKGCLPTNAFDTIINSFLDMGSALANVAGQVKSSDNNENSIKLKEVVVTQM